MAETKTLRQTVNFLGFLRGQLNGLQGIPTLCYELIQNADDVKDENGNPAATRITFDICDDALYVYNDGVFREIDFERMVKVSWGNKREEEGTTGAFGLGFLSVYQITDSPEIFSSGRHWQFIPNGHENERIRETLMETKETKFRLPWAFDESEVRKELGILPVARESLNEIARQINHSIESSALFLKQVSTLELKQNGRLIRKIEAIRENDQLLLADGNQNVIWRIFEGRFEAAANEMRRRYGGIIENKRQPTVKIAVPDDPKVNGLLYAFLPSETPTGLPFHINADFYPSPDRKRIIFGDGFKAEWNELSIQCATEILADHCNEILEIFSNQDFWEFAERIKKASTKDGLSPEFSRFWELLKPQIKNKETVLTSSNKIVLPTAALFLDAKELTDAENIFGNLGLNIVHSDLRSRQNLLLETGVQNLKLTDICSSFVDEGFTQSRELASMTEGLKSLGGWETLWSAIENLWNRAIISDRRQNQNLLKKISIAFGMDGRLWPPEELFIADQYSQDFYSKISEIVWFQAKTNNFSFFDELIPQFTLADGLGLLKEAESSLPDYWKGEIFSPEEILEWFEKRRSEINDFSVQQMRSLSIWPTAEGELKPLTELYLAGDFEDPLRLAQLVDLEALGGGRDFLERVLNMAQLDFITYVRDWVPSVILHRELKLDERFELIRILAENLGKLRDHPEIRMVLSGLPIVWCGGEEFYPASIVWFDTSEVRGVLGPEIKLARLPGEKSEAIREFYLWIGVSPEPAPEDIVNRIIMMVKSAPNDEANQLIGRLIDFIASKWISWEEKERDRFALLRNLEWLPGTKDVSKWFDVRNVYTIYSSFLFESQGNFLHVERKIQQNANDFFKFLGIESEPNPEQVVRHLLYCSQFGKPITQEVYVYLNRNVGDSSIDLLKRQKCLYLKNPDGSDEYFFPDQVFWDQHSFGKYRYRLSPDYGRFKSLFDKIGVKEKPDVDDAIKVLLEISNKFGTSKLALTDTPDEEMILIMCWKLITEALENERISKSEIKRKLGNQKTIPDSRKLLTKPELMFFEDRPGWGEKFKVVKNNLAPRIEGVWLGMEAAGVRPLSSVIETEMITCENRTENKNLLDLFLERKNLIQRVIEEHRNQGIKAISITEVERLSYYRVDKIDIVRIFNGFGQRETSDLESVDAILLDGSLDFSAQDENYPWKGIARELSYVINSTGELRSLGMELKEILSQSLWEARKTLDELGYPIVEIMETSIAEGQTLEPGTDEEDLEGLRVGINFPEAGKKDTTHLPRLGKEMKTDGATNSKLSPQTTNSDETLQEKRKSSRLRSYVYPESELSTKHLGPRVTDTRTAVAEHGVERVMQYEREQGRVPKDMDKIQVHHPGYDIESKNSDGTIRYIEVKSLSGVWDSQNPAEVTKFEFETAKKFGEAYWLYVVELVELEDFCIHTIQNPATRVEYYLFDHGWIIKK
jgi:hypothetical protein